MKKYILIIILLNIIQITLGQETEEWKTQTFTTGYFSFNGEYIDFPVFKDVKDKNFGVGIAEASILSTIRPLEKLKINSVISFKPRLEINQIIAELSAEWSFSEQIKLKLGRFLLPLHPANTQYYAPMNFGIALPIFVTNHALFPLNINGINFNGDLDFNDNVSMCYNFSAGEYKKMDREEAGLLGFFGREGAYLNENSNQVNAMILKIENMQNGKYPSYLGAGGKLCLTIGDFLKFGGSTFFSKKEATNSQDPTNIYKTNVSLFNYGANLIANYNNIHLTLSAWFGNETPDDIEHFDTYNIQLLYGELAYSIGKITPYTKVEIIDGRMKDYSRITAGINYRPFFETTFKIEFHQYIQEYVTNFNVFQFSTVYSF